MYVYHFIVPIVQVLLILCLVVLYTHILPYIQCGRIYGKFRMTFMKEYNLIQTVFNSTLTTFC